MNIRIGSYRNFDLIWTMLESTNNSSLLLCRNILEYLPFHETYEGVIWENSTLRTWLNNEFYNSAFNEAEKQMILDNMLERTDHAETIDRVWLLSAEEAYRYFASDKPSIPLDGPAPYLKPIHIGQFIGARRRDVWLLRSNAAEGNNLCEVSNVIDSNGDWTSHQVNDGGRNLNVNCIAGIRPVIRVRM